jgi:hypothetical protein
LVTNLATATLVKFQVKLNRTDADAAALISKTSGTGGGITVNSPSSGWVSVALTSANTTIAPGNYFFGLKVLYASTKYEVDVMDYYTGVGNPIDTLVIDEDIVHDV